MHYSCVIQMEKLNDQWEQLLNIYLYTLIKRAKIVYIYIYIYIFVSCVYFENGSTDFNETNSINKFGGWESDRARSESWQNSS